MTPCVGPAVLDGWMRPFRCHFTAAVWRHVVVLVGGALLAPGRRTVAAALRVMGLGEAAGFAVYHRVLSHGHWCSRALAHRLLLLLVVAFVPDGPVVVGLDDTIERRWGARIAARGIYRDPVRSSHGHFVKASGLRWLSVMLLAPVPWAGCIWGLPFLTVLAPSERYAAEQGKRHKKLTDWARQALLQVARWLPGRRVVAVADSSFSAIALLRDLASHLTVVSRRASMPACASHPRCASRGGEGGRRSQGCGCPVWSSACAAGAHPGVGSTSMAGMATAPAGSTSPPAPHSGTIPACGWQSAGCWCATRVARRSHRPFSAPI
ncbi:transposase [Belnapia sp. T18]|uniref:Transposase n=1 Tax=Belnapia arida TaxID=2804533 RepID=A0ABS1UEN5_9PROT|nr:transposase [Belnapia arida]MBL6082419.1 transposase [Belnapia arida]